jgi:hypothetical protein
MRRQPAGGEWQDPGGSKTVGELVDKHEVPNLQRVLHGGGWDAEGFDDEGLEEQGAEEGHPPHKRSIEVFTDRAHQEVI